MQSNMQSKVTMKQAAGIIGVSYTRVVALVQTGRLSSTMFGNQYMLDRAEVERFARTPRFGGRPRKVRPAEDSDK